MAKKTRAKRVSARTKALRKLKPGEVALFKVKTRRGKREDGTRGTVGFSAQFNVNAEWSVLMDTRILVRLIQVRLGEHFQDALAGQFDPNTGRPLPRPSTTRVTGRGEEPAPPEKKNRKLGIRTGKMLNNWQIGRVSGKFSRARGIVQPFMQGGTGPMRYQRRFFIEYFLGLRTYKKFDPKTQKRDARGRCMKHGASKGDGPRYEHAPIDFQHVDGLAAIVIRDALDQFIKESGLWWGPPMLPDWRFGGAGKLSRVRDASGF